MEGPPAGGILFIKLYKIIMSLAVRFGSRVECANQKPEYYFSTLHIMSTRVGSRDIVVKEMRVAPYLLASSEPFTF